MCCLNICFKKKYLLVHFTLLRNKQKKGKTATTIPILINVLQTTILLSCYAINYDKKRISRILSKENLNKNLNNTVIHTKHNEYNIFPQQKETLYKNI